MVGRFLSSTHRTRRRRRYAFTSTGCRHSPAARERIDRHGRGVNISPCTLLHRRRQCSHFPAPWHPRSRQPTPNARGRTASRFSLPLRSVAFRRACTSVIRPCYRRNRRAPPPPPFFVVVLVRALVSARASEWVWVQRYTSHTTAVRTRRCTGTTAHRTRFARHRPTDKTSRTGRK